MQRSFTSAALAPIFAGRCAALMVCVLVCDGPLAAAEPLPALRVLATKDGVRFGLFGEKPAAPAPTLFILAGGIEEQGKDQYNSQTGQVLAADGWISVVVEIPCHGADRVEGEPGSLAGWAHRVKTGQDLMGPFTKRCSQVLDHLIAEKYTDPQRVALSGTSRGGFCALHFAAADPRVRAVTGVSPVTNPLVLSEFAGVTAEQAKSVTALSLADRLAGRAVSFSIGNDDARVGTDDCIATARALVAAARKRTPAIVPVEVIVGPSAGHRSIDQAYELAAAFIRRNCPAVKP